MKTFLIGLLITLSVRAEVGIPFTFNEGKFKISEYEYKRYIKPQVRFIINDFYNSLKQTHSSFIKTIPVKTYLDRGILMMNRWIDQCQNKINDECYQLIQEAHKTFTKVEAEVIKIQSPKYFSLEDFIEDGSSETAFIQFQDNIKKLHISLAEFSHLLEQTLMTYNTSFQASTKSKLPLKVYLNQFKISFQEILLGPLPTPLYNRYTLVIKQFINPLESQIIYQDRSQLLKVRLEYLNFSWNHFHAYFAKGNRQVSKKVLSTYKTIHNRWNSILKVLLR